MTRISYPATIALAGTGKTTKENITELLNDWLFDADDPPTTKDITFYLVTTLDSYGETTEHLLDWIIEAGLPFTVITDNREPSEDLGYVYDEAKAVEKFRIKSFADDVSRILKDAVNNGHAAHLVLSWGPQDVAPDPLIDDLLIAAHDHGIIPLDLSQGLEDLLIQGPEQAAPEPEKPTKPQERKGRGRRPAKALETEEKPLAAPKEPPPPTDTNSGVRELEKAIGLLREVLAHLREDESSEPINVWVDAEAKTIRKARRGRPRKGEVSTQMTMAQIEAEFGPQDWS